MKQLPLLILLGLFFASCNTQSDEEPSPDGPKIRFQFEFDDSQPRLGNLGTPATIPAGNAAQTPDFHELSVHVIDLTPNRFTPYGDGFLVYKGAETTKGGANAIDFDEAIIESAGNVFKEISIKDVPVGTYEFARVSVAYQSYDVKFNINNIPVIGDLTNQTATVASFLGFNNYVSSIQVKEQSLEVNDDKLQGFWAFETTLSEPYQDYNDLYSGEAPAGATTVVNPLAGDSDIPAGSCVVTGEFAEPLIITGNETEDILVTLSFSINNSFEWKDNDGNGQFDFYSDNPAQNDQVVDMGLRGLVPMWSK